jgi:hypothetical protein
VFTDILALKVAATEGQQELLVNELLFSGVKELLDEEKLVLANQVLVTHRAPNPVVTLLGTELIHELDQEFHSVIGVSDFTNGVE